jgi:hypothetical protein
MMFDLAMAAAPVTASLGHQRQHRIAKDLQYRVQTQMVGRLLRGADEAVKEISSTLAGVAAWNWPLQRRKVRCVCGNPVLKSRRA